jgi:hypothetical protein
MAASISTARWPKSRAVPTKSMVVARMDPAPNAMQGSRAARPGAIQPIAMPSACSGTGSPSLKATTICLSHAKHGECQRGHLRHCGGPDPAGA